MKCINVPLIFLRTLSERTAVILLGDRTLLRYQIGAQSRGYNNGNVEKSRQRRSRHFAVLTYSMYAPRVKMAAALLDRPFGKTQGMLF